MAAKKKSAPTNKPPVGGSKVGSRTKKYLDQGVRSALGKVDWEGVGRLTESAGSQGPKKKSRMNIKSTTKSVQASKRQQVRGGY